MTKPNQKIDEITQKIYPPAEAVVNQLSTIRAIIPSTIKMYESTGDIHTIQPNLDMIERAVHYLRGAPMQDALNPDPNETVIPIFTCSADGLDIITKLNQDGEYEVSILGININPEVKHTDLFGELDFKALEMVISVPVICGKTYLVTQKNPALAHFPGDLTIDEINNEWVKEKEYDMTKDTFEYAFLLLEGRTGITITFECIGAPPVVVNITSHIHFKDNEVETNDG